MNKVNNKKIISMVLAILFAFSMFPGLAFAAGTTSFSISTEASSVKKGETFTVVISGKDISDMSAYEVKLSYPSGLLTIKDENIEFGLSNGIPFTDIDTEEGNIIAAFAKKGDAATESGNLTLCTLTFTCKAQGNAQISFKSVKLLDKILAKKNYTVEKNITVAISEGEETSPTPTETATPTPTAKPMPTPTPTSMPAKVTLSASVQPTTDPATGTAVARVEADAISSLADNAKQAEASGQKVIVEIKVETTVGAKAVEVEIPRDAFKKVADTTNAEVKVNTGIGTIAFDAKAVENISKAAEGDISIGIESVDKASLSSEAQAKVGDRPVYDFSVSAGGAAISHFGGGKAQISIPYALKPGEKKNSVIVYYIDDKGKLKTVNGKYDDATGAVVATLTHFSIYAIGYNEVNFSDVAVKDWFSEAVGFIAARSITSGVGGNRFAPEANITRGDFLVLAMNAYGIEPEANITDNFADAGNKYYTGYLAKAKQLGLATGVGDGKYAPEVAISRQDMFVLLYRILKNLDELPEGSSGRKLESFKDTGDIASYAKEAMKLFVETGAVSGDTGGNLTPKAMSTRAHVAQVLYNLLSR